MYDWDLNKIYNGVNSDEFKNDMNKLDSTVDKLLEFKFEPKKSIDVVEKYLVLDLESDKLFGYLYGYLSLRTSVNTQDNEALKMFGKLDNIYVKYAPANVRFLKYLKGYPKLLEDAKTNDVLKKYPYYLSKLAEKAKRMLSDETEIMLTKLSRSSGDAWERLFDTLTSTVEVDYDGKTISLPEVRNLAYSPDEETRKKAYEAELKAYKKIDNSIAAALSSIKQEVTTITKARKYSSPLEKTLVQTGMTKKTLKSLISAIEEYYPYFRAYLKRKGEMLGHKNGLPFYDLFAPVGKCDKKFTIPEANEYLIQRFTKFNPEIGNFMKKAMENNYIDYLPKPGKVGGAFCSDQYKIKEVRILSNFDGTFNAVCTLAHELGHGFHAELLWDYPEVYSNYPMQLAETASTFNETYIRDAAISEATSKAEKLNILEAMISDDNQVIVDIMSRYYFETSVFEMSDEAALTPDELCDLMKEAQLKSYGDGLDPNYLHPYMWCCKGHYYSTGLSFYNFPYAFGQLFAYGLYSIYKEKGADEFFPLYKKVLIGSGQMPIRECVLQAGIDVESIKFWRKSLDICKKHIQEFLKLTK